MYCMSILFVPICSTCTWDPSWKRTHNLLKMRCHRARDILIQHFRQGHFIDPGREVGLSHNSSECKRECLEESVMTYIPQMYRITNTTAIHGSQLHHWGESVHSNDSAWDQRLMILYFTLTKLLGTRVCKNIYSTFQNINLNTDLPICLFSLTA